MRQFIRRKKRPQWRATGRRGNSGSGNPAPSGSDFAFCYHRQLPVDRVKTKTIYREETNMHPVAKLKTGAAAIVAATAIVAVAGLLFASGARTEELKHYDSSKKDFWLHPPDDWFMGDETQEQKGTHVLNTLPPPTGFTDEEVMASLKNVKLPHGFQDRTVGEGSRRPADGVGRQRYAVRRLVVRRRQSLCGRQTMAARRRSRRPSRE